MCYSLVRVRSASNGNIAAVAFCQLWLTNNVVKAATSNPATYADLLAVPDELIAQIVDGELITSPHPSLEHSRATSILGDDLSGPFDRGRGGPGGWWILFEPELHLVSDILVPDLAGWRRSRVPHLKPGPYLEVAPDWVCEVLSPSTRGVDRVRKMPIYLREKVTHLWFIDPQAFTLEVFRADLAQGRWVLWNTFAGDDKVRAEPFEAVELELSALWLKEPA